MNIGKYVELYSEDLRIKNYADNTIENYASQVKCFLEHFKQLANKAGLKKKVWTHLMRHCSFTHLLENGTDLGIIQKLAGHSNIKTTQIYTHISHNIISKVNSPLNNILL